MSIERNSISSQKEKKYILSSKKSSERSNDSDTMSLSESYPKQDSSKLIRDLKHRTITLPYSLQKKKSEIPFHIPHRKFLKNEGLLSDVDCSQCFSLPEKKRVSSSAPQKAKKIADGRRLKCESAVDLMDLLQDMKTARAYMFVYLSPILDDNAYVPYSYRILPFKEINAEYFLTISTEGVVTHDKLDQTFTPLLEWEKDFMNYQALKNIKLIGRFRLIKSFNLWRKAISFRKLVATKDSLRQITFFIDPALHEALLIIRSNALKYSELTFVDLTKVEDLILKNFFNIQVEKLQKVMDIINHLHGQIINVIYNACNSCLAAHETNIPQILDGNERVTKTSFVEQVIKKRLHFKLGRFTYLINLMSNEILMTTVRNSYLSLSKVLRSRNNFDPLSSAKCPAADNSQDSSKPQNPLFHVWVKACPESLYLDPCCADFVDTLTEIMDFWVANVLNVRSFSTEPNLSGFIRPIFNNKEVDCSYGVGPSIGYFISMDHDIQACRVQVVKGIEENFELVNAHIQSLLHIYDFMKTNLETNVADLTNETDPVALRQILEGLVGQLKTVSEVIDNQPIGLLLLHLTDFKKDVIPTINNLLTAVQENIPKLCPSRFRPLLTECNKSFEYLQRPPKSTSEFVSYLSFIDSLPARLEIIDEDVSYLRDVYQLVFDFKVPCPEEDLTAYTNFLSLLGQLKELTESKQKEKGSTVLKLNSRIEKDAALLTEEILVIHEGIKQAWLIKQESDPKECTMTLNLLAERLAAIQLSASVLRGHQKLFKLEASRFLELDAAFSDLTVRQLLWESLDCWKQSMKEFRYGNFNSIDPDEVTKFVAKTLKNAQLIEKALGDIPMITDLKEEATVFKERIPIMSHLRNPALKPRHWLIIENLLNHRFLPGESFNLELLESCGVLEHIQVLEDLSAQATSEGALENLLKRVETSWQTLEFGVVNHRGSKDVFILSSVEEVQQVLDESYINVNTILSSRHVGPIKTRVQAWYESLNLFSKTLDAWTECQMNWLYLESIFSAPDIQRQLPTEGRLFNTVDRIFKSIMRRTKENPLALQAATTPGILENLITCNNLIDQILKCLEAYLESKRIVFPRFYFLSNEELLEILAQTRNVQAVQPHMGKCFDAIKKIDFGSEGSSDITAMFSPEGERVQFLKTVKARGNVEDWLCKVEEMMVASLRKGMKTALTDSAATARCSWVLNHPAQIVLAVSQIIWCQAVHKILDQPKDSLREMELFEQKNFDDLSELAAMVRGDMASLERAVVCALITISVHSRDIISHLVAQKVTDSSNFEWLKCLRYYWEPEVENCLVRMSTACLLYGYEYLGASPRLVVTPLTDKCYLCLSGALMMDLGGAPSGPAGTGKTETTKDLAKAVALQCVVFNCSESLDFKMMGRFFSGLAQSGAWCCFDEFNRIDIEVLSVIAQQLLSIRNAKVAKLSRFIFEGREIKLVPRCAVFITMNPGYAGRTELPDNLKSLFRPISMMIPDYALIAEVILYSEGFETSKILSQKMTQLYKLCSEQLSQQNHYDFGMRALKSVLVMAGILKRSHPDVHEDIVLIRALRDSNIPKFLAEDIVLFQGILGDVFPGVSLPSIDYGDMERAVRSVLVKAKLEEESCTIRKVIQFYETLVVRHGVMLVGPAGGGKTTVLNTLKAALTQLHDDGIQHSDYIPVRSHTMNPKSITIGELYGETNPATLEWRDGVLGMAVRRAAQNENDEHEWIVCDGPVDAVWIENMNTVLDDNKTLCLANSERIRYTSRMRMVFEVEDLEQASPATVSRCGMIYVDPNELKFMPYVRSWVAHVLYSEIVAEEFKSYLLELFKTHTDDCLLHVRKISAFPLPQVDISKVITICKLLQSLFLEPMAFNTETSTPSIKTLIANCFVFATLWSIGGGITEGSRATFELFVRTSFKKNSDVRLPENSSLWNFYIDVASRTFEPWKKLTPEFTFDSSTPFFDILVPTTDTVRFSYMLTHLLAVNCPVLYTGETGVGKSAIAKSTLSTMSAGGGEILPVAMTFSAQTSSARTQEIIELNLEKKKKTMLGAPHGKRVAFFIDDINMPALDVYGSQPPVELLRQYLDFGGFYDRERLFWKDIVDVILCAACAPPGGGRNKMTARFVRHFALLVIPSASDDGLATIFQSILRGFLDDFTPSVRKLADDIVGCAISVYQSVVSNFLPSPLKCHYVFNLRDLSKCVQGILRADPGTLREPKQLNRLFYHECLRVFQDRLICNEDKITFFNLMKQQCNKHLMTPVLDFDEGNLNNNIPSLLFGNFMNSLSTEKVYEEITDYGKLKEILLNCVTDYNEVTNKSFKLVLFKDAVEHCCRIARILGTDRGNGLLVGLGGMGKQTITRLASHLNGFKCLQPEMTSGYDYSAFQADIRRAFLSAGAVSSNTTFLITDTQIIREEFLEDINNILNSGEVPNLFDGEEREKLLQNIRSNTKDRAILDLPPDQLFNYFINNSKSHLHLIICMSPIGDSFRRRCRLFPSLVNCCTIDWFLEWPADALLSVAQESLLGTLEADLKSNLAKIAVTIHQSVGDMAIRLLTEKRRHYYSTPSNYLQMLDLFNGMLEKKTEEIVGYRDRFNNGLKKLYETYSVVETMKAELVALEPLLVKKSEATADLMKHLAKEQAAADNVRQIVMTEEAVAKVKADETQELADEAQRDLAEAMPAMEAAVKALEALSKSDIGELKVFNKPPDLVKLVMEAVCLLFGAKQDWASAKTLLSDVNFLKKLREFEKDNMKDVVVKKLRAKYIEHPDFIPDKVAVQSKVCRSLCMWVRALDTYAKVYKVVEPKKKALEIADKELTQMRSVLREKQRRLAEVESQIATLEASLDTAVADKMAVEDSMALTSARLGRSARLTSALGDEQVRWEQQVQMYGERLQNIIGDILLAAGSVANLGAFTSDLRSDLLAIWIKACENLHVPVSKNFSLVSILSDAYEVRNWTSFGLPRDAVSSENGVLVIQAAKSPLMIDPQGQANRWIRNLEASRNIHVHRPGEALLLNSLAAAVRAGEPVLLEDVGETLDPSLEPLLLNQTFISGGVVQIRIGESNIEYNKGFRMYLTTKLANPHYLPETCIMVTLVNFTVTVLGIEDQLLADVVRLERPDLELARSELISRINADKQQIKNIEDKILRMLFQAKGNILDDEELIDALNESKETTEVTAARVEEAELTEKSISLARDRYRPVALRGAILYSVVSELPIIDPMYQYSLTYVTQVFCSVMENTARGTDVDQRVDQLKKDITFTVYTNVARGLFERHKLVFSFIVCSTIYIYSGIIKEEAWQFFLHGPQPDKLPLPENPYGPEIPKKAWMAANYLSKKFVQFKDIEKSLAVLKITIGDLSVSIDNTVVPKTSIDRNWNSILSDFDKLLVFKAINEEQLVPALTEFVKIHLGKGFVESPSMSLKTLYQDTSNVTPLIFILSPGSDPAPAFLKFASKVTQKIHSISLGQGQGPIAEKMLTLGAQRGDWIFLQNCHLAGSWMPSFERKFLSLCEDSSKLHADFRLFLSAMPFKEFPGSILQNAVKVTNEPPRGLRANLKRALGDLTKSFFEDCPLQGVWRKLVFGVCFFHGFILQRKNFGPLGWNIPYEFNDNDRNVALTTLDMFCVDFTVPWAALEYITGEITYGGRVTDPWDLRCLVTALRKFFSPKILEPGYMYSESGIYYCPESADCCTLTAYQQFVDKLPLSEHAEVFGLSEYANKSCKVREAQSLLDSVLELQLCESGSDGKSADQTVIHLADTIVLKFPENALNTNAALETDVSGRVLPLTTVLLQEVARFKKLLSVVTTPLRDLKRGVKGEIVLSNTLEEVYRALIMNQVPKMWGTLAYPSLKSLGSWVRDLELRVDFMSMWLQQGRPPSYWLSGLIFPQGFLTAVLQTHARKMATPIDSLAFHFHYLDKFLEQETVWGRKNNNLVDGVFEGVKVPTDGVLVHGLFLEAGRWDCKSKTLIDPQPTDAYFSLPIIWICPKKEKPSRKGCYECPLYKTAGRAGTLSTTGTSTNFILPVLLPSDKDESYWTLMGTALLSQLSD